MNAIAILKKEYKEGLNLEEGLTLATKVLTKTLDSADPGPERCKRDNLSRGTYTDPH